MRGYADNIRLAITGPMSVSVTVWPVSALDDDPADHRGLLSWINQVRPASFARSDFRGREWNLEDAGSYGYRVSKKFDRGAVERAIDEGVFKNVTVFFLSI